MAKSQRSGKAWKSGYTTYKAENRQEKNKIRRLKRYLKDNPNDLQAAAALKRLEGDGAKYTRNHRPSGKGQTIVGQEEAKTRATLARLRAHDEQFKQKASRKPSPSDIHAQLMDAFSRALSKQLDKDMLG